MIDGNAPLLQHIAQAGEQNLAVNLAVAAELLYMAELSGRRTQNMARVEQFLTDIHLFELTIETASIYAALKADLLRRFGPREKSARRRTTRTRLGFDDNDLWIASTAIQHDLTVVSADSDFTRIAEVQPLRAESWLPPAP